VGPKREKFAIMKPRGASAVTWTCPGRPGRRRQTESTGEAGHEGSHCRIARDRLWGKRDDGLDHGEHRGPAASNRKLACPGGVRQSLEAVTLA